MLRKILSAIAILFLMSSICAAKSVQVSGQGATERAAIHNAMRMAIEEVLGATIDAKTLVRNSQVIEDEISTNSDGYVSGYSIISKKVVEGFYHVEILAEVNDAMVETHLMTLLQKKTLINTNADNPRIAVMAYDAAGQEYAEVENEILAALKRQGFSRIVDINQVNRAVKSRLVNAENDSALRKSLANDFHVDYIVLSEVKLTGQNNITLASRLVSVNTGKIIYAGTSTGNVGMFTANPGAMTLKLAARRAGQAISVAALSSAANVEQHITLLVTPATFKKIGGTLTAANTSLKKIDGVNDSFVRRMSETLELDVNFDGTAADLAVELERAGFKVVEVSSDYVKI